VGGIHPRIDSRAVGPTGEGRRRIRAVYAEGAWAAGLTEGRFLAMSKQSENKDAQGYRKQSMSCQHCKHFSSEFKDRRPTWASSNYVITEEKNIRCNLGGFAVQKTASCDKFERKI
jgi:hypothetical protein